MHGVLCVILIFFDSNSCKTEKKITHGRITSYLRYIRKILNTTPPNSSVIHDIQIFCLKKEGGISFTSKLKTTGYKFGTAWIRCKRGSVVVLRV